MPDIKTRDVVKGTVKAKSATAAQRTAQTCVFTVESPFFVCYN